MSQAADVYSAVTDHDIITSGSRDHINVAREMQEVFVCLALARLYQVFRFTCLLLFPKHPPVKCFFPYRWLWPLPSRVYFVFLFSPLYWIEINKWRKWTSGVSSSSIPTLKRALNIPEDSPGLPAGVNRRKNCGVKLVSKKKRPLVPIVKSTQARSNMPEVPTLPPTQLVLLIITRWRHSSLRAVCKSKFGSLRCVTATANVS